MLLLENSYIIETTQLLYYALITSLFPVCKIYIPNVLDI